MSILKLELTLEHIDLLKGIDWKQMFKLENSEGYTVFGGTNIYEDVGMIIYGVNDYLDPSKKNMEYDVFDEPNKIWSDEQIAHMDKLIKELPLAIEVALSQGNFEDITGKYKAKFTERVWVKG